MASRIFNYETKKMIVEKGGSKIFNNWKEYAGISMEDFLEGLKWLCEDHMNENHRLTRELGCYKRYDSDKGELVKLYRSYTRDGSGCAFYRCDTKELWGRSNPSISAEDWI